MCQKIAIAQALLPRPGLLVLDEAWTGLDVTARGALDDAVAERTAAGGSVLFVDHDPARRAGRADERWRLGGDGRVAVTAGLGGGAVDRGAVRQQGTGDGAVMIELAGVDAAGLARLAEMPGVMSSSGPAAGRVLLRVAAPRSDAVLRRALTWDGVHVAGVAMADQGPRP
jgi:ABC-type uncharacterized transport system ATPase subunit